jgi:hypothetical protein
MLDIFVVALKSTGSYLFSGVTWPKFALMMAALEPVLRRFWSAQVPVKCQSAFRVALQWVLTEVLLALCNHSSMDALRSLAGEDLLWLSHWDGRSHDGSGKDKCELHGC